MSMRTRPVASIAKRLAPAILAACALVGLTSEAAMSSPVKSERPNAAPRMGFIMGDYSQNQLILEEKNGATAEAKKLGISLNVQGTNSPQNQVAAIQDMTATHVDALIYGSADPKVTDPAIQQAQAAGIPLVCTVSCTGETAGASVDFNYRRDMGRPLGVWIAKQLPKSGGKIGFIDTSQADPGVQDIYKGIHDGLNASHKKFKIYISPPTNWDAATAATVSRDFLTAHPDLNVVVGMHDLVTAATLQSMKDLHYRKVPVAGLGGTCEGLKNILSGQQTFTVLQDLYPIGSEAVDLANGLLKGTTKTGTHRSVPMFPFTKASIKSTLAGNAIGKAHPDVVGLLKAARGGCR